MCIIRHLQYLLMKALFFLKTIQTVIFNKFLGIRESLIPGVGLRRHNKEHRREQADRQARQHYSYTQLSRTGRQLEAEHQDERFSSGDKLDDVDKYRGARETARAQGAPNILKQVYSFVIK